MLKQKNNLFTVILVIVLLVLIYPISVFACSLNIDGTADDDRENRPNSTWVPPDGEYVVSDTSYWTDIRVEWFWPTANSLKGLKYKLNGEVDSNEALEIQTVFYNYDGKAYCKDYTGYWETNQPNAYLDTRLSGNSNELDFCVGCANANNFTYNRWYYYYVRAEKEENSLGSKVKVQAQRSCRCPSSCYSTYCVFAEGSQPIVTLIPFSEGYAPGWGTW